MSTAINETSRRREVIYLSLMLIPLALVTITLLVGFVREAICSVEVNQIIAKLKIAGEPVDAVSSALANRVSLTAAELAERGKIENAAEHINRRYSNLFRKFQIGRGSASPDSLDKCEHLFVRYSKDAQPIVQAMEETDYASTNTIVLTEREFDLAYHQGNTQRALEILRRFGRDEEFILKSLEFDVWTADDLKQLRAIVDVPSDPDTAYLKNLSNCRAQFFDFIDQVDSNVVARRGNELMHPFGIAPSHERSQLLLFNQAEQLRTLGTRDATDAAESIERNSHAFSLLAVPLARANWINGYRTVWLENSAKYAWKSLMNKRRVITAIAIKQFKLQEGRWPESLDELTKVGLTSSDWKIVGNQDFGYRVVEDGKAVLLWTGGIDEYDGSPKWYEKSFQTPSRPPSEVILNTSTVAELQSTIR